MPATITCLCGHDLATHTQSGPCNEPTGRCQCDHFYELCPACRHPQQTHDGPGGACARIKQTTRQPCGCTHPATNLEANGG